MKNVNQCWLLRRSEEESLNYFAYISLQLAQSRENEIFLNKVKNN